MLSETKNGVIIDVLATPGASVSKIRGEHGGALKVAVRSPPENGRANAEIESLLAEYLGLPGKSVSVISGHTSRRKRVLAEGISIDAVCAKFAAIGAK